MRSGPDRSSDCFAGDGDRHVGRKDAPPQAQRHVDTLGTGVVDRPIGRGLVGAVDLGYGSAHGPVDEPGTSVWVCVS
jgi:hypothetical protein